MKLFTIILMTLVGRVLFYPNMIAFVLNWTIPYVFGLEFFITFVQAFALTVAISLVSPVLSFYPEKMKVEDMYDAFILWIVYPNLAIGVSWILKIILT